MSTTLRARLSARSRAFAADEGGNIAVIFALALLPMLGFVGAAVDYSRASAARAAMQTALDSATLMLAKEAATSSNVAARGQKIFNALYKNADVPTVTVNTVYTPQNGARQASIVMTGSAQMPTVFMGLFGFNTLTVGTSSTTAWGNTRLRIALALDNTGSMDDAGKMDNLKSAAKAFVARLKTTTTAPEDLYVSVVPFIKDVNVGNNATVAPYLDWSYWESDSDNQTCGGNPYRCTPKNHSTWTGCVTDRQESYDVQGNAATGASTYFSPDTYMSYDPSQGKNIDACTKLQPMLPLTNDMNAINSKIDAMKAFGGTNQPIGLFWAWWTLRQNNPYKDTYARDPNYKYITAIVLFTDGLNTRSRKYGDGSNHSVQIDDRQRLLCTAIKNDVLSDGTTPVIYAVQVDTDGSGAQQVLKDCVYDPKFGYANYFFMTAPSQIASAFSEIASSLSRLRITQ